MYQIHQPAIYPDEDAVISHSRLIELFVYRNIFGKYKALVCRFVEHIAETAPPFTVGSIPIKTIVPDFACDGEQRPFVLQEL